MIFLLFAMPLDRKTMGAEISWYLQNALWSEFPDWRSWSHRNQDRLMFSIWAKLHCYRLIYIMENPKKSFIQEIPAFGGLLDNDAEWHCHQLYIWGRHNLRIIGSWEKVIMVLFAANHLFWIVPVGLVHMLHRSGFPSQHVLVITCIIKEKNTKVTLESDKAGS